MKSATSYKAAVYQHSSFVSGFWMGRAIDKQINSREVRLSNYWISEFLDSDFRTTSAAGSRRLAVSLRDAAKKVRDIAAKGEIAAAVTLARSLSGQRITIREFTEKFGLSESAKNAIFEEIKSPAIIDERFQFNEQEFSNHVAYRSVELDTGGMLTAQSADFDRVFRREVLDETKRRVRFSAEGRVVDEKLGKTR